MKSRLSLLVLASLIASVGCGSSGGGPSSIVNPTPVHAQSGYSNSSITGTYSIVLANESESDIGSFSADGNGNISNGSLTANLGAGPPFCTFTFTGTYSLQSTAAGTATITSVPSSAASCTGLPTRTLNFMLQAGQQGETIVIMAGSTANNWMYAGTAVKQ